MPLKSPYFKTAIALLLLGAASPVALAADGLELLGTVNGGATANAVGVSADGSVIAGYGQDGAAGNQNRAFRWTQTGGMQLLGTLNGGTTSVASSISGDGLVIVGTAADGGAGNANRAFRWTQGGGLLSLGLLNGGTTSAANGVNSDGSVVVGQAADGAAGNQNRAFRWTQGGGIQSLGTLNGGNSSIAYAVNEDGSVVVGNAADGAAANGTRAMRWTQGTGIQSLGLINNGSLSIALSVSDDGNIVAGVATDGAAANKLRAFRWTQGSGMQSLGVLNGGTQSYARDISGDGTVIVGNALDGAAANVQRAFRWTQGDGIIKVDDWLRNNGVTVAVDITKDAYSVNSDGSVVVGITSTNQAFIARVAPVGSGLITINDYVQTLEKTVPMTAPSMAQAELAINGANSMPMRDLLSYGESSMAVTGDLGREGGSGHNGLAEISYSHGVTQSVQAGFSLGLADSAHSIDFGGKIDRNGAYFAPEIIWNLHGNTYLTLNGYYGQGEVDSKRGYLNAGTLDDSSGDTDIKTLAARARLDFKDMFHAGGMNFTPNISHTYAHSRADSYTETGGGFPVHWNEQTDESNVTRVGVDANRPLTEKIDLLVKLEGAYRYEDQAEDVTGNIIGLGDFRFNGDDTRRAWVRGGIGAGAELGAGSAMVMLNGTTGGGSSNYWATASYGIKF